MDYVLGLAKNRRLEAALQDELAEAQRQHAVTGHAARVFKDFFYHTLDSWRWFRRVVGRAEYLAKGQSPRFVVSSLSADEFDARMLIRRGVLPARRDGKSDQGTAVVPS